MRLRERKVWITFGLIALLAIVTSSLIAWGSDDHDAPPIDPDAGTGGWQVTALSQNTPNDCHVRGEICMEWCVRTPGGYDRPTGDLCCVKGGLCRAPR